MAWSFRARLLAAALLLPGAVATAAFTAQPALAQSDDEGAASVSFESFYQRLAPYGRWFQDDRWGYVWHPEAVGPDFQPYYDGHWVNTEQYGWFWVSDEPFGDIVYHYGRWVYDPQEGWLWVPGYVWAPAWVIWRGGEGETGWFPMPPDEDFYAGDDSYQGDWSDYADDYYGYSDWYGPAFAATFFSLWIFVDDNHFGDRDFHRHVRHHRRDHDRGDEDFFRRTHDATRYKTVGNFVVNRGVDPDDLRRRTGQAFAPVQLRDVLPGKAPRPTPIDLGRKVRQRELRARPDLMPNWFRSGAPAQSPWRKRKEAGPPPAVTPQGKQPPSNVFMPHTLPTPPVVQQPSAPQGPKVEPRFKPKAPERAVPPAVPPAPPPHVEKRQPPPHIEKPQPPPGNAPQNAPPPKFQGSHPSRTETPPPPPPPPPPPQRFEGFHPSRTATPPPPPEPKHFERFQPPATPPPNPPVQHFERVQPPPPPPPPPAATTNAPPPQPAATHEDHAPRDHPRRDRPQR